MEKRFKRWCEFGKIYWKTRARLRSSHGTIIRAQGGYTKDSKDQEALGRSKFTAKIHALVDALGIKFTLIKEMKLRRKVSIVVGDKGYDSNAFFTSLEGNSSYSTKTESKEAL